MPAIVSVVPVGPAGSTPGPPAHECDCVYQAEPCHALPTIDLSITLKSRLLSRSGRRWYDRLNRYRAWFGLGFLITCTMYIVVLFVPPPFARGLAVVGLVTGLPGATYTIGWLRYDILKVLVPTYDIIFFDFIVVSTLGIFMATLGDARMIGFLPAFVANQFNIFIDANTQSVRITMIMNAIAFVSTMGVAVCSAFGVIPDFPDKTVLSYGVHYMNSHDYLTNGFITTGALMLRTLYRKRADLLGRSRSTVIQCVSY